MAVRQIRVVPDEVLRQKAKKVPAIDASIKQLIEDMIVTMQEADGVGLAAPQVGVSLRVIVLQMPEEEPFGIVNPEVVKRSGERMVIEGCLSVPGYQGELKRSEKVTVKGLDREGKKMRIRATELLAQALEHEIDHIDGVLYTDRIGSEGQARYWFNAISTALLPRRTSASLYWIPMLMATGGNCSISTGKRKYLSAVSIPEPSPWSKRIKRP
jgi:peptide deformylase